MSCSIVRLEHSRWQLHGSGEILVEVLDLYMEKLGSPWGISTLSVLREISQEGLELVSPWRYESKEKKKR